MIVKRVDEGFILPRGYGVAWVDYMRNQAVCLPVPINVMAAIVRACWHWMLTGHLRLAVSSYAAYQQGRADERKQWMNESVRVRPD